MLRITQIPVVETVSDLFQIQLNGIPAQAYFARASAMPFNRIWPGHQRPMDQTEEVAFLGFSADGPVQVELIPKKSFREVTVRPLSRRISPVTEDNRISFTLFEAGQYTVETDGPHHALHLFLDPAEEWEIDPSDPRVICFPAGVHHAGLIHLESNETLYLHRDAVVYGAVIAVNAENIRIIGHGILDGSHEERTSDTLLIPQDVSRRNPEWDVYSPILSGQPTVSPTAPPIGSVVLREKTDFLKELENYHHCYSCIRLYGCKNTVVQGITLRDAPGFAIAAAGCEKLLFDRIKLIGMWRYNSDGIDLINSRDCAVRRSFLRNFDDCVVLKGIIGWDTRGIENILVEDCVLWCDWGRSLEIGAETCAPFYRNVIFRQCDCIHVSSTAMDIQHCDFAHIHHICYENIRVELSKYDMTEALQKEDGRPFCPIHGSPRLIFAGIAGSYFSIEKIHGRISDILYRDIAVYTDNEWELPKIIFSCYSKEMDVRNIRIENLTVNGKRITDPSCIETNAFVTQAVLE